MKKTKYETDFLTTRKIEEDNLINQINSEEDDHSLKNSLLAKAKAELQKVQQLVIANDQNEQLNVKYNKELKNDIIIKNDLILEIKEPSQKLLDRIQSNQDYLDDLTIKIDSVTTNIGVSEIDLKAAISELRRVDPKAANALENSLNLKKANKETREINQKRI
jgi:hypothetical protein